MQLAENERRWVVLAFAALIWLPPALVAGKLAWDAAFYSDYAPDVPIAVEAEPLGPHAGWLRGEFRFQGAGETMVPAISHVPAGAGPWPTVVFLHGIGQDKDFVDEIAAPFIEAGFAIVSFDQHTRGERAQGSRGVLQSAWDLRRRSALTVLETRRLLDALEQQPWADASRLYLVGASYGAMTGAAAAAFDPRLRKAALIYGGGDLRRLLDSPAARETAGILHAPARWTLGFLLAPADPVRHVRRISPRPILMINGTHDPLVPPDSAQALHAAAGEPKETAWIESGHIGEDPAVVMEVIARTIHFLTKNGD